MAKVKDTIKDMTKDFAKSAFSSFSDTLGKSGAGRSSDRQGLARGSFGSESSGRGMGRGQGRGGKGKGQGKGCKR